MVNIRTFLAILIFTINFQILCKADDISDFEIEGMSVGSTLLDHFSLKKIKSSEVNWYDDLEKNRYVAFAFDSPNFETYDFVDVWTKYNDDQYLIDTIAGVIYFDIDKKIKDIKHCYKEQKIIADDLMQIFSKAKKEGPLTLEHSGDPSGESTYTDIYLKLDDKYEVVIACYDWSDKIYETENKEDHIYISIRSLELEKWLR